MNEPITPETEPVDCPQCKRTNPFRRVEVIDYYQQPELVDDLMNGLVNFYKCTRCGYNGRYSIPLRFIENGYQLQYIPSEYLQEASVLDKIIAEQYEYRNFSLEYAFSMDELLNKIFFRHAIGRRFQERKQIFHEYKVPPDIARRIAGRYKKRKLKIIAYIATFFEKEVEYTREDVYRAIRYVLLSIGNYSANLEPSHLASALCELGFLSRLPDESKYWVRDHTEIALSTSCKNIQ